MNKIILCSRNGWPDLECVRSGKVIWIECKAQKKKADALQEYIHKQIREHGGTVYVIDSWEEYLRLKL